MLSEVFWVAFVSTVSGLLIKVLSLCYKSKCKEVTCLQGCITCIRDTEAEEKETEFELTHPRSQQQRSPSGHIDL